MELKVWVDGVARVVCGLSLDTSCKDVVIALAQAIGQTGRYILFMKLRGTERQLVAEDCPLHRLTQLGQLAAEVQFILRRTGPSLSGQDTPTGESHFPLPLRPEPHKHNGPPKALTFNSGPSKLPRRTKPNRDSPPPRASSELRASPNAFLETIDPAFPSSNSKEEVFKKILQQQRRLQDLDIQLCALERETESLERESSSDITPVVSTEELEELEQRLRQNNVELMQTEQWEEQLEAESEKEQEMQRRLNQINSSMENHSYQMKELEARSAHLEQTLQHTQSSQKSSRQSDEALKPLQTELYYRLLLGEELNQTLTETQMEIQDADKRLQDRLELDEELNKELRQCKLQQFIQQTGSPQTDQMNSLPVNEVYLSSAELLEYEQTNHRHP